MKNESNMVVITPEQTGGRPIKVWATKYCDNLNKHILDIDEKAYQQACQTARLPFIAGHVALMPDSHAGYGVPIGCVVPTDNVIIPNAVGSDIGCGMNFWNSGVKIKDLDIRKLMIEWKETIPIGEGCKHSDNNGILSEKYIQKHITELEEKHNKMLEEHGKFELPPDFSRFYLQIGTLGGGNHFVEIQRDQDGYACIMIHSGSRGYGANTAKQHHNVAIATCQRYFSKLETKDLAYLPVDSKEGRYYIAAMQVAQDFAFVNRKTMMRAAQLAIRNQVHNTNPLNEDINIHHNYAAIENHKGKNVWVHRKGATLARKNTTGIIPGSMTTHSYIVQGKGNPESFNSCSHGSGRNFSRTEAKKRVLEGIDPSQESQLSKANVELYGSRNAEDELGSPYKCVDQVMENQQDLVEIKNKMIPVAVLKG